MSPRLRKKSEATEKAFDDALGDACALADNEADVTLGVMKGIEDGMKRQSDGAAVDVVELGVRESFNLVVLNIGHGRNPLLLEATPRRPVNDPCVRGNVGGRGERRHTASHTRRLRNCGHRP